MIPRRGRARARGPAPEGRRGQVGLCILHRMGQSTTAALAWCEVSANAISASLAHSVPPASASVFTQSVMNSVMHWSTAVSTKVTRNHGPCAKERARGHSDMRSPFDEEYGAKQRKLVHLREDAHAAVARLDAALDNFASGEGLALLEKHEQRRLPMTADLRR